MEVATPGPAEQVGGRGHLLGGGTRGAQTYLLLHPALGVGSTRGTAIHPHSQTWKLLNPPPGSPPRALARPAHQSMLLSLVLEGSPGRGAKSHTSPVGPLRAAALGNPRAVLGPHVHCRVSTTGGRALARPCTGHRTRGPGHRKGCSVPWPICWPCPGPRPGWSGTTSLLGPLGRTQAPFELTRAASRTPTPAGPHPP